MRRGRHVRHAIFLFVLLATSAFPAGTARAALSARVVDASSVRSASRLDGAGRLRFVSAAGVETTLALDAAQLDLANPIAGGDFAPMSPDHVRDAIAALRLPSGPDLPVTVYCLPGLPLETKRSFCRGTEVFLAPGLAEVPANVVAYTVVHELGHALQHATMPQRRGERWEQYVRLRGLDDEAVFDPAGIHRNRPQEIFAEDFRALCGGALATYSGTIENTALPLPRRVAGLERFFTALLAGELPASITSFNAPNPFNPRTTISIVFPATAPHTGADIQIVDLRGRLVTTLWAAPTGNRLVATWQGRDGLGREVATGRYLYRATIAGRTLTGSMLLVK